MHQYDSIAIVYMYRTCDRIQTIEGAAMNIFYSDVNHRDRHLGPLFFRKVTQHNIIL